MSQSSKNAKIRLALSLLLALLLCGFCLIAPMMIPNDPNHAVLLSAKQPPSAQFPLGTDALGRCVYSRLLAAAPVSVYSALAVVTITVIGGCIIGITSGYFGGVFDACLMRVVDIFLAFPEMVLALAVVGMMGKGMSNAIIAFAAVGWTSYARLARSSTLALREENFVYAAKLNGQSGPRIMIRHFLPSVLRPIIISASNHIGGVILGLSGMSFLGLGAQPPAAEWGNMLSENRSLMQQAPWLVLCPGVAICVTVIVFNLLGDSLRDVLDPAQGNNVFAKREQKKKVRIRSRNHILQRKDSDL